MAAALPFEFDRTNIPTTLVLQGIMTSQEALIVVNATFAQWGLTEVVEQRAAFHHMLLYFYNNGTTVKDSYVRAPTVTKADGTVVKLDMKVIATVTNSNEHTNDVRRFMRVYADLTLRFIEGDEAVVVEARNHAGRKYPMVPKELLKYCFDCASYITVASPKERAFAKFFSDCVLENGDFSAADYVRFVSQYGMVARESNDRGSPRRTLVDY